MNPKKPNSIIVHGNQDVKNVLYKLEVCLAYSYRNEKKLWKKYDYGKEGWTMSTLNHYNLSKDEVVIKIPTFPLLEETCERCIEGK